ncbi:MAG: hypothetical protein NVS2B14_04620 [Chamaesiphon sp.]
MPLRRISTLGILLLSLGSAVALADSTSLLSQTTNQTQEHLHRRHKDWGSLMQQLNRTQAQQQELDTIRNQSKDQMSQRKQAMHQAAQELRDLMVGTATDDQIRDKYKQVQALRQQLADLRFENLLAMRKVLTPEQRQKFAQLMQQRSKHPPNRTGTKRLDF